MVQHLRQVQGVTPLILVDLNKREVKITTPIMIERQTFFISSNTFNSIYMFETKGKFKAQHL